jgi:hypothetical protein
MEQAHTVGGRCGKLLTLYVGDAPPAAMISLALVIVFPKAGQALDETVRRLHPPAALLRLTP